ncbi:MAG: AmmeMemoRadiSam system radical SAM enzyme [Haliangiales bacterium]
MSRSPQDTRPYRARFWTPTDDDQIVCHLCPRACRLSDGQRAFCFVRENRAGEMVLSTYGRSSGFCIDPIEKKPLNHFYPGTSVLSFGTAGCNLGCKFCQNWSISKAREWDRLAARASPDDIAQAAHEHGCHSVAFTYNDPVIFAEYAIDVAAACRARGIKTVAVTAGYITEAARGEFFAAMDAVNVDLKAFRDSFYHRITFAHLEPVLDTLRYLRNETEVWFEVTTLLIPGHNDSPEELDAMCAWFVRELGPEVPLHFTAFHPDFRMDDVPATPPATLARARETARSHGIAHVYTGNVHDVDGQSSYCAGCGARLIERDWYRIGAYRLTGAGACPDCGHAMAGRFGERAGTWGARRLPIAIG